MSWSPPLLLPKKLTLQHRPPVWQDFTLKLRSWCYFFYFFFSLLQIWFSVELSVTRVDDTSWEKVNPYSLIKSDIPIHSHAGPAFIEWRDRGNQAFWFWFGNPLNVKVQLLLLFSFFFPFQETPKKCKLVPDRQTDWLTDRNRSCHGGAHESEWPMRESLSAFSQLSIFQHYL